MPNMLIEHMAAVESHLLSQSRVAANAGHSLHKGTPREWFVRDFLQGHLSERVAIGSGELIDASSQPRQQRNQFDVVISRREYPRLPFGGGVTAFLAESVVACIEIKSVLDKQGLLDATRAAMNAKALSRHLVTAFTAGFVPPTILNFVVAYDGPARMRTVAEWMPDIANTLGIRYPVLPLDNPQRYATPSPAVDGIFVLGRGFIHFGNLPLGFLDRANLQQHPLAQFACGEAAPTGALFLLFILLTHAVSGTLGSWLDPAPYATVFAADNVFRFGMHED